MSRTSMALTAALAAAWSACGVEAAGFVRFGGRGYFAAGYNNGNVRFGVAAGGWNSAWGRGGWGGQGFFNNGGFYNNFQSGRYMNFAGGRPAGWSPYVTANLNRPNFLHPGNGIFVPVGGSWNHCGFSNWGGNWGFNNFGIGNWGWGNYGLYNSWYGYYPNYNYYPWVFNPVLNIGPWQGIHPLWGNGNFIGPFTNFGNFGFTGAFGLFGGYVPVRQRFVPADEDELELPDAVPEGWQQPRLPQLKVEGVHARPASTVPGF